MLASSTQYKTYNRLPIVTKDQFLRWELVNNMLLAQKSNTYNPSTSRKDFQTFVNSLKKDKMNLNEKLFDGILNQIEELVDLSRNTINAELEVHIGRLENKKFISGVSKNWFDQQLLKLESFSGWEDHDKEWNLIEEYIFDKDIRLRRNPDGVGTFMKKTLIKGIDIKMDDAIYDLRIVLKSENNAHINYGEPNYLRFKERKTFTHKNFTYFFSKIWEGKNLDQICKKQPKYEIELECTKMIDDSKYLTKSMIIKCKDIIGTSNKRTFTESFPNKIRKIEPPKLDAKFFHEVDQLCKKLLPDNSPQTLQITPIYNLSHQEKLSSFQ